MFGSFENFKKSMNGKTVCVVGIGVSNMPLIHLLCESGAKVVACDKKNYEKLGDTAAILENLGVELHLGDEYLSNLYGEYLFKSPGIRPDLDEFEAFKKKGGILTSEMEVFFDVCPIEIIAVTGSDGKTTTTTLISKLLEAAGIRTHVGGNIGRPLLASIPEFSDGDKAVVELSSFQLMTMKKSPSIAVITNVTPNHLDVHKSMDEYVDAKLNIMRYQTGSDRLIINMDNEITKSLSSSAKGTVIGFSRFSKPENGIELKDNKLYYNGDFILDADDILLPGIHNVENYMAAYAACEQHVTAEQLRYVATHFTGVEHRIEFIREYNGVKFYNDSIASSPTRTLACINAFYTQGKKITVIAGGSDKKLPFDELAKEIVNKVKRLYLCGKTAESIKNAVANVSEEYPVSVFDSYDELIKAVCDEAENGDVVVLSPACPSFDMFNNFEHRGNTFKKIVSELK